MPSKNNSIWELTSGSSFRATLAYHQRRGAQSRQAAGEPSPAHTVSGIAAASVSKGSKPDPSSTWKEGPSQPLCQAKKNKKMKKQSTQIWEQEIQNTSKGTLLWTYHKGSVWASDRMVGSRDGLKGQFCYFSGSADIGAMCMKVNSNTGKHGVPWLKFFILSN